MMHLYKRVCMRVLTCASWLHVLTRARSYPRRHMQIFTCMSIRNYVLDVLPCLVDVLPKIVIRSSNLPTTEERPVGFENSLKFSVKGLHVTRGRL